MNWYIESQYLAHGPSTASKYSSNLAWSQPPKCISTLARLWPPSSHNHGLQVQLQTHSIKNSECISKFTRSRPPSVSPNTLQYRLQVHLQTWMIMALKCIWKQSWSRPWSVSPNKLDDCLQLHHYTRSITASEDICEFIRSSSSGAPGIALKLHLQPVEIYCV